MPSHHLSANKNRSLGFSLIELMVGVTLAIIASIVMFQVFAVAERQKRTVTGASDAQINGALALDTIERSVRMASFGIPDSVIADCKAGQIYTYYDSGSGTPGPSSGLSAPVTITDGGASPDKISINFTGDDFNPNFIFGYNSLDANSENIYPASKTQLLMGSTYGCQKGQLMWMVQPGTVDTSLKGNCTLIQITNDPAAGTTDQQKRTIEHVNNSTAPYNPPDSYQTTNNWPIYRSDKTTKAYGVCIQTPQSGGGTSFFIQNRQLMMQKGSDAAIAISSEIMDLQATVDSTNTSGQATSIRISLIARSAEYEKPTNATATCETTTTTNGLSKFGAVFDTSTWPADWKCYRYKVFETLIPLRNVILSAPSGS